MFPYSKFVMFPWESKTPDHQPRALGNDRAGGDVAVVVLLVSRRGDVVVLGGRAADDVRRFVGRADQPVDVPARQEHGPVADAGAHRRTRAMTGLSAGRSMWNRSGLCATSRANSVSVGSDLRNILGRWPAGSR